MVPFNSKEVLVALLHLETSRLRLELTAAFTTESTHV